MGGTITFRGLPDMVMMEKCIDKVQKFQRPLSNGTWNPNPNRIQAFVSELLSFGKVSRIEEHE